MICMEVAGMKRVLFKIVLPVFLLTVWMITCYPICCKAEKFDFFCIGYWLAVPMALEKCVCFSYLKISGLQEV